ncbi:MULTISPECIES: alpha-amylase [unclassified Breznakia]|uniref:alpha-amylase n=1 Tax=unclassified Breznakia TaxID=2623764 RepID=UPI002404ED0B|nr:MULTISPECIES: alpha-amylase [unclassified Breznakia]
MENKTILQGFEWYLPEDTNHWNYIVENAHRFKEMGFYGVWLPPAYKGAAGIHDVGYGVYDLYDLGEFDQKGAIPTKYGTKDQYLHAIRALHDVGLEVYADIVFDHFIGADETEEVDAIRFLDTNRNQQESGIERIKAWTKFTFPKRHGMYNDYVWTWKNFKGVNWDEFTQKEAIYGFEGKKWEQNVDNENGNFDYLMGADLDMDNPETVDQLNRWGNWYQALSEVDGYRLDAVKHIRFSFFIEWLKNRRSEAGKDIFAVGEYWNGDLEKLENYLDSCGGMMSLFDVPLHFNLQHASNSDGRFDMRNIFENTLLQTRHNWATTFVDNHDTQPGQSLESWIEGWFKPQAYALILLKDEGIPCVFFGDLFGIPKQDIDPVGKELEILIKVRKYLAYGPEMDYFDHPDIIGFTRFGDTEHEDSGVALVVTNAKGGVKRMSIGAQHVGEIYVDCLGNRSERLEIEEDGCADFAVNDGSVSVWVSEKTLDKVL